MFHWQIYCWAPFDLSVITQTQRSVRSPLAWTVSQFWCALLRRKLHLDSLWHFSQGTFTTCEWSKRHCLLWLWLAQPLQRLMVYLVSWEEACFWQSDCFTVRVCVLILPHFLSTLGWPKQRQTESQTPLLSTCPTLKDSSFWGILQKWIWEIWKLYF